MIYLDHSATSLPKAPRVAEAMSAALALGNPGRSGYPLSVDASRKIFDTREKLGSILGCDEERVIFTSGATESLNIVIRGMLKNGGCVISTDLEHNSVARPLERGRKEDGWDWLPLSTQQGCWVEKLSAELKAKPVDLVVVNHVSNVTGETQDLEKIHALCLDREVPLLVDVSQSVGIDELRVGDMMALAGGGHKGLMGPTGIGFLALGAGFDPVSQKQGGTGSASEKLEMPLSLPDRLEPGTPNICGIVGLGAALEHLPSELGQRKEALGVRRSALFNGLEDIPQVTCFGSIVGGSALSIATEMDMGVLAQKLWEKHEIAVRVGLHCSPLAHQSLGTWPGGTLRISPSPETPLDDIQYTLQALNDLLN